MRDDLFSHAVIENSIRHDNHDRPHGTKSITACHDNKGFLFQALLFDLLFQ